MRAAWIYIHTVRALIAAVWVKLLVALGLLLLGLLFLSQSVHFVPPISARVVDAVSGKPLAGMNVCLEATVRNWKEPAPPRSEETQTDPTGRFSFSSSIIHTDLFQNWLGYSVRVTDPRMDIVKVGIVPHCGTSLTVDFIVATTFMRAASAELSPLDKVDRPLYFPVAVGSRPLTGLPRTHAVEREMGFPLGGRIALIPLLGNVDECHSIKDPDLGEYCRALNGSAAAETLRALSQGGTSSQ
jgi:hypothetical protein